MTDDSAAAHRDGRMRTDNRRLDAPIAAVSVPLAPRRVPAAGAWVIVHSLTGAPQYNYRVGRAGKAKAVPKKLSGGDEEAGAGGGGAAAAATSSAVRIATTFRFEGKDKTVGVKPCNLRVLLPGATVVGKAADVVTSVQSGPAGRLMSAKQCLNGAIGVVEKAGEYEAPKARRAAVVARANILKERADTASAFAPPWPPELLAVLAPEMLRVCAIDMSVSAGNAKLGKDHYSTAARLVDSMETLAAELKVAAAAIAAAGGSAGNDGSERNAAAAAAAAGGKPVTLSEGTFDAIAGALFSRYSEGGRMAMASFNALGGDTRLPDSAMQLTEPMWKGVCQTIQADPAVGFDREQFALFFGTNRDGMAKLHSEVFRVDLASLDDGDRDREADGGSGSGSGGGSGSGSGGGEDLAGDGVRGGLRVGNRVKIVSLKSAAHHNNKVGTVLGAQKASGRYVVQLDAQEEGQKPKDFALKAVNCKRLP